MKAIAVSVLILLMAVLLYTVVERRSGGTAETISFNRFMQEVERNNVAEVTLADSDMQGRLRSGETFKAIMPTDDPPLIDILEDKRLSSTGARSPV